MQYRRINDDMRFVVEQTDWDLRLIITHGPGELACRKTALKAFKLFLSGGSGHLFKGRLQLHNNNGAIALSLKGIEVGVLNAADIASMLNSATA